MCRESFSSLVTEITTQFGTIISLTCIECYKLLKTETSLDASWIANSGNLIAVRGAWVGQFLGNDRNPTVLLHAIGDYELLICGVNGGRQRNLNDINIFIISKMVHEIMSAKMVPGYK